jgi:membrane-associated phospholipid phosphatase
MAKAVNFKLPLFMSCENKYPAGALMFGVATGMYILCNRYHLFEPRMLPMGWVDQNTPLMPWTVWVYLSEYVFFAAVYTCVKDLEKLNQYFYSFLALQTVSCVIFVLWPTTFPRELYPLTADSSLTYSTFAGLRSNDRPSNCCPSLHVSAVYLSTFLFTRTRRGLFPFFFAWATAISLSTLTTKQHYLVDVVAGFLMALLFHWWFSSCVFYRWGAQAKR